MKTEEIEFNPNIADIVLLGAIIIIIVVDSICSQFRILFTCFIPLPIHVYRASGSASSVGFGNIITVHSYVYAESTWSYGNEISGLQRSMVITKRLKFFVIDAVRYALQWQLMILIYIGLLHLIFIVKIIIKFYFQYYVLRRTLAFNYNSLI